MWKDHWQSKPGQEPPITILVSKQVRKPWSIFKPKSKVMIANPTANPINKPIISPTPSKRPRSVAYELDTTISSATSCESDSNSDTSSRASINSDSTSSGSDESRPRKRQKRKPNPETMAYYHRCLGHAGDVQQLSDYGIDLCKEVSDKAPCVSCLKIMRQPFTKSTCLTKFSMPCGFLDWLLIFLTSRIDCVYKRNCSTICLDTLTIWKALTLIK